MRDTWRRISHHDNIFRRIQISRKLSNSWPQTYSHLLCICRKRYQFDMASCSCSSLLKRDLISCGANWKNPDDFQCVVLEDCKGDVTSHLKRCKVVDESVENELRLLLGRAGNFLFLWSFSLSPYAFVISLILLFALCGNLSPLHLAYVNKIIVRCSLGVFKMEGHHSSSTVCPRHREVYGVGWKTGERFAVPFQANWLDTSPHQLKAIVELTAKNPPLSFSRGKLFFL